MVHGHLKDIQPLFTDASHAQAHRNVSSWSFPGGYCMLIVQFLDEIYCPLATFWCTIRGFPAFAPLWLCAVRTITNCNDAFFEKWFHARWITRDEKAMLLCTQHSCNFAYGSSIGHLKRLASYVSGWVVILHTLETYFLLSRAWLFKAPRFRKLGVYSIETVRCGLSSFWFAGAEIQP